MKPLHQFQHPFLVGVKGVAMANLAVLFKKMGKTVSGSDVEEAFITDVLLQENRIDVVHSFRPAGLPPQTDLVIYSGAHGGTHNPQVDFARHSGLAVMHQAGVINRIADTFKVKIAVCGCHGKTTTTALLAYGLTRLGKRPSYLVGAPSFHAGTKRYPGAGYHLSDYFVWEADEYGVSPPDDKTPKISYYASDLTVATNIDFDHPDVYQNIDQVKNAYLDFFRRCGQLVFCGDDHRLRSLQTQLRCPYSTFGYGTDNDLAISGLKVEGRVSHFCLSYRGQDLGEWTSALFGEKNISNLSGVVLALLRLGFPVNRIKTAIAGFSGVKRRMELVYQNHNYRIIDDYAHHPREIEATIQALRRRFPERRLLIVFQPHTFSRTKTLSRQFARALSQADLSLIVPIFVSARESPVPPVAVNQLLKDIARQARPSSISVCRNHADLLAQLAQRISPGDIMVTMGAGDVYKLKNDIIRLIR